MAKGEPLSGGGTNGPAGGKNQEVLFRARVAAGQGTPLGAAALPNPFAQRLVLPGQQQFFTPSDPLAKPGLNDGPLGYGITRNRRYRYSVLENRMMVT